MTIVIEPGGIIRTIYTDELLDLLRLGVAHTTRASFVEPTADGRWTADMSPLNGPVLGPFDLRQTALDAEVVWLEAYLTKEDCIGHAA